MQPEDRVGPWAAPVTAEILALLRGRLESRGSALMRNPAAGEELERQVGLIVEEVLGGSDSAFSAHAAPGSAVAAGDARLSSVEAQVRHARQSIRSAESLLAASLLFETALPVILSRRPELEPRQVLGTSLALHAAIMDRILPAAPSYGQSLAEGLHASRWEERRRIARDIHDRLAPSMALALHHLDLHGHYGEQNAARATAEVATARDLLTEALSTVQQLAASLRRSVTKDGIEHALREYLNASVPADVNASLDITGDARTLPPEMTEELYLILREAIRNALSHADPTELRMALAVNERSVTASVTDNGRGFSHDRAAEVGGGGLLSMAERARLLGGVLQVKSSIGRGAMVSVTAPLGTGGP